jgi:diacylglycerol kinase family enzyme
VIPAFVNPAAGNAAAVDEALRRSGCFEVLKVDPAAMTSAARELVERGVARIAAVGGDGSVSAVAAAVARTNVELAIIPAGTFNHFARDHRIPTELQAACEVARTGRVIATDVAWVNDRLFLNTSSVGVYANYVRVRERLEPRLGYWLASAFAMLRTFARVQPFRVAFETEQVQRQYVTPLVFIGSSERELKLPTLGNRVEDGTSGLHVLIVRGRTRARLVALAFAAAARGTRSITRTPHLDGFLVDRCIIEQRHSTVAVDGEIVRLESPLRYEIDRGSLRLVVPEGDRAESLSI